MKFVLILVSLFLVVSCSSGSKRSTPDSSARKQERPDWIENPSEVCGETHFCGVGEGGRRAYAESDATQAIARIFSSHVRGSTTSDQDMSTDEAGHSETSEDFTATLKVSTEELLKGVQVKKTWEDRREGTWYALAVLDKRDAANTYRNEMKDMDETIIELFRNGTRAGLNKILRMFKEREQLNKRFEVATGSRYKRPVTVSQVMKKKREKAAENIKVSVKLDSKIFEKELKDLMTGLLIDNDYKLASSQNANYKVEASLAHQKEHMKAEGFSKYKFRFEVRSVDANGTRLGALSYNVTKPGRNLRNCYQKALPDIKNYLMDNLDQLKID